MTAEFTSDLHHKMSKKIAQLTKVIYLLNTKNDEHEYELKGLEEQYESDIDQVLKNAYVKINEFRRKIEENAESKRLEEEVSKLRVKYDAERADTAAKVEKLKKAAKDSEALVRSSCKERMDALKRDVDDAKATFVDRYQSFVRALKQTEQNHSSTIEEIKKTYTKETADLVQKTNQQYNTMLTQRMAEEDKLRAELAAAQQRDTLSAQQQTDVERRLKAAREAERAAMQKELKDMRDKADAATKAGAAREAEAMTHMLKLNQELTALRKAEASLTMNLDATKQSGSDEIKRLQAAAQKTDALLATANTELASAQSKLKSVLAELDESKATTRARDDTIIALTTDKRELTETVKRRDAELQSLLSSHTDVNGEIQNLRGQLNAREKELNALQAQARTAADTASQGATALRRQLEESQSKHDALQARMTTQATKLAACEDLIAGLKANEKSQSIRITELEGEVTALARKNSELNRANSDALADLQSKTGKQLSDERAAREKRVADVAAAHAKALADRDAAHTAALATRDAERTALQSQVKEWESKWTTLSTESSEQRNADAVSLAKYKVDLSAAQSAIDALKQQTSQLNQSSSEAVDALRKEMEKLQADTREARERERADTSRGLTELRAEHQKELEGRTREYEAKEAAHRTELTRIDERSRSELATLRRQMQDAQDARSSLHTETAEQIERMKLAHARDLNERELLLRAQNDQLIKQLNEKHANAIAELKSGLSADSARQLQLVTDRAANESAKLRRDHQTAIDIQSAQHAAAIKQRISDHDAELIRRELAANRQRDDALAALTSKLTSEHTQQSEAALQSLRDSLTAAHTRGTAELQTKLAGTASELAIAMTVIGRHELKISTHEQTIAQLHSDARDRAAQWSAERSGLLSSHDQRVADIQAGHRDALTRAGTDKHDALRQLADKASTALTEAEARHAQTQQRLDEVTTKYLNRESRPDDLQRMQALLMQIADQEKLVRRAVDEMKYYKLELLNREENYNKTFGRSPKVNNSLLNVGSAALGVTSASGQKVFNSSGSVSQIPTARINAGPNAAAAGGAGDSGPVSAKRGAGNSSKVSGLRNAMAIDAAIGAGFPPIASAASPSNAAAASTAAAGSTSTVNKRASGSDFKSMTAAAAAANSTTSGGASFMPSSAPNRPGSAARKTNK